MKPQGSFPRFSILTAVIASVVLLIAVPAGGEAELFVVTADLLNIRPDPSTNNAPVFRLAGGSSVRVLEESRGWYRISCKQGSGWAYGAYLAPANAEGVRFLSMKNGYELFLPKEPAESLQKFLRRHLGEDDIARFLARILRMRIDPRVKLVAAAIALDVLLFKKKLGENMGDKGVRIRVWGPSLIDTATTWYFEQSADISYIFKWINEMMDPEANQIEEDEAAKRMRVATTVPIFWRIRPLY